MQTKSAIEFIQAIIKAGKSDQITNALLNGTCIAGEDNDLCVTESFKLVKSLQENKDFCKAMDGLTAAARRSYRLGGAKFESIVGALIVSGLIAGIQFALDGGKATHDHGGPNPDLHAPDPKALIN